MIYDYDVDVDDGVTYSTRFTPPYWILFLFFSIVVVGGECIAISMRCPEWTAVCVNTIHAWEWLILAIGIFLIGMTLGWFVGHFLLKRRLSWEQQRREWVRSVNFTEKEEQVFHKL